MPTTAQLAETYKAAADACAAAPASPEKQVLIVQRNAAASAYFRARYEAQRVNISRIQRQPHEAAHHHHGGR